MAQDITADERLEAAKQQAAHMRPAEIFLKGPGDLAPTEELRQSYARALETIQNREILASIDPFRLRHELDSLAGAGINPERFEALAAERERRLQSLALSDHPSHALQEYRDLETQAPWTPGLNENGSGIDVSQKQETYAEELRRRARERGQELRESVPTQERDQDRSDDLERW